MFAFALYAYFLVSSVFAHAYFTAPPTPRLLFCSSSLCTGSSTGVSNTSGLQGSIWLANTTLLQASGINGDSVTRVSCGTSLGALNSSALAGYADTYTSGGANSIVLNPGNPSSISTTWTVGTTQSLSFWINQIHPGLNNTNPSTDGWQLRYRDATSSSSAFTPLAVSFSYGSTPTTQYNSAQTQSNCVSGTNAYCTGPFNSDPFPLGSTISASFVVPNVVTSDLEIQFFWTLSGLSPSSGIQLSWMSCTDVKTVAATTSAAATFFVGFATFLVAVLQFILKF
jgi:hypothetical protein